MSWIFAISSSTETTLLPRIHDRPLWTVCVPHFYLAVGGIPETCIYQSTDNGQSGWAIVGHGIRQFEDCAELLAISDWIGLLRLPAFDSGLLDGSFIALRWQPGVVECFTDQLGLRTLYFSETAEVVCVSTRLEWAALASGKQGLNLEALGGRWLLFNQLDYDSGVIGIDRLGPGGRLRLERGKVKSYGTTLWSHEFSSPGSPEAVSASLRNLISVRPRPSLVPSIGLSGGMDSRLLLALMSEHRPHDFVAHSYGADADPDIQIARRLATSAGISLAAFNEPLPDVPQCIDEIRSFAGRMELTEPVSSWSKLRYYPWLREQGMFLIDGGFGEVTRRQYLKRFAQFGKAPLRSRNLPGLLNLMRSERSDLLSAEVQSAMERGALESLRHALDGMPDMETIGMKNFADLLVLRTRVPNYGSPEQARIDEQVLNIMPLAQPSFLRGMFALPLEMRTNGKYFLDSIRQLAPGLSLFPLVKSGCTYPFGVSTGVAWLLTKAKSRLRIAHTDQGPHLLLHHLRGYILDTAHSRSVLEDPLYNAGKVIDVIDRYFNGEVGLEKSVDWWLTFELWKRSFERRS